MGTQKTLGEEYSTKSLSVKKKRMIAQDLISDTMFIQPLEIYKILIAFVGIPGSGKSTISSYLGQQYGFNTVSTDVIKKYLQNINIEFTKLDLFYIQAFVIKDLLKRGLNVISDSNSSLSKHRCRLKKISEKYEYNLIIIRINCNPEICFQRVIARNSILNKEISDKWHLKIYEYLKDIQFPKKSIVLDGNQSIKKIQSDLIVAMKNAELNLLKC